MDFTRHIARILAGLSLLCAVGAAQPSTWRTDSFLDISLGRNLVWSFDTLRLRQLYLNRQFDSLTALLDQLSRAAIRDSLDRAFTDSLIRRLNYRKIQAGAAGKYLYTDGTSVLWSDVPAGGGVDADTIGREGRVFLYQSRGGIAILGQRFFDNYGNWFAFNSGRIPAGAQLGTAPVTLIPYKIAITHMHDSGAWYRRDTVINYMGMDSIVAGGRFYTQYYFQESGSLVCLYKAAPHASNASFMTADPGTTSYNGYAGFQIPFFQGTLNMFSKNARIDHFIYVDIYFRQKIPGRKYQ